MGVCRRRGVVAGLVLALVLPSCALDSSVARAQLGAEDLRRGIRDESESVARAQFGRGDDFALPELEESSVARAQLGRGEDNEDLSAGDE